MTARHDFLTGQRALVGAIVGQVLVRSAGIVDIVRRATRRSAHGPTLVEVRHRRGIDQRLQFVGEVELQRRRRRGRARRGTRPSRRRVRRVGVGRTRVDQRIGRRPRGVGRTDRGTPSSAARARPTISSGQFPPARRRQRRRWSMRRPRGDARRSVDRTPRSTATTWNEPPNRLHAAQNRRRLSRPGTPCLRDHGSVAPGVDAPDDGAVDVGRRRASRRVVWARAAPSPRPAVGGDADDDGGVRASRSVPSTRSCQPTTTCHQADHQTDGEHRGTGRGWSPRHRRTPRAMLAGMTPIRPPMSPRSTDDRGSSSTAIPGTTTSSRSSSRARTPISSASRPSPATRRSTGRPTTPVSCATHSTSGVAVHAGAERPLVATPKFAAFVHGESGLDGAELPEPRTPVPIRPMRSGSSSSRAEPRRALWLVPTGPLTNIALALRAAPDLADRIAGISLMGGGTFGNRTPLAEFNIWADPEAAAHRLRLRRARSRWPGST